MLRRDFIASMGAVSALPSAAWSRQPECEEATASARFRDIPLGYNDARFAGNAHSDVLNLPSNGAVCGMSITQSGRTASIVTRDGAAIRNCRVKSRECVRIGGSGTFLIDNCYLEALGAEDDHADVIQAYAPGQKGVIRVSNTAIVSHGIASNAGLFIADNWTGTIDIENVAFIGGGVNFGLRIHPDVGGDNIIRLKNVFFIPPFRYAPFLFGNVGGRKNNIVEWDNVALASIDGSKIVISKLLLKPMS